MVHREDIIVPVTAESYGASAVAGGLSEETASLLRRYVEARVLSTTGEGFLDGLVRLLWAEIDAYLVFVGLMNRELTTMHTAVTFRDGRRSSDFSYSIAGTPCETVVAPLQACVYPDHVCEKFPQDKPLADANAESYVGLPLFDRLGNRLGVMVAVSRSPMEDPMAVVETMRFFARRAALELEQMRALEAASSDLERVLAEMRSADNEIEGVLDELS